MRRNDGGAVGARSHSPCKMTTMLAITAAETLTRATSSGSGPREYPVAGSRSRINIKGAVQPVRLGLEVRKASAVRGRLTRNRCCRLGYWGSKQRWG